MTSAGEFSETSLESHTNATMGRAKEFSTDQKKLVIDLIKSGESLGATPSSCRSQEIKLFGHNA